MKATRFQSYVQERISNEARPSLLLVAPTGLGKTFAVTGDLLQRYVKTVYAVPLRALGNDIQLSISKYRRNGIPVKAVVHHGSIQDSELFGEEVVVTTYDQVVCGVPGLPLSMSLKAGHAVAGALLMSRLIFDEAHLAWGISDNALSILFAIVQFRAKYRLQTILLTATLPDAVSRLIAGELGLERVVVGIGGEVPHDEALDDRDRNRAVVARRLEIRKPKGGTSLDFGLLDDLIAESGSHNRIYFANTVDRIQETYDRLLSAGVPSDQITVLHNRMPPSNRAVAEEQTRMHYGRDGRQEGRILLTNQVAEAGLDISASLVVSDPAPVDTLVQRAGRCARWFRDGLNEGRFYVVDVPGLCGKVVSDEAKKYALPYRHQLVAPAVRHLAEMGGHEQGLLLTWENEREWVNLTWGGDPKAAFEAVSKSLDNTTFALNLFDRAAQEHRPGLIANAFREILSVGVAVAPGNRVDIHGSSVISYPDVNPEPSIRDRISAGEIPETSSVSLGKGFSLLGQAAGGAAVIRWEGDGLRVKSADSVQLGDILVLPSSLAYLHSVKGLCFGDGRFMPDAIEASDWYSPKSHAQLSKTGVKRRQTLAEHTQNVLDRALLKLTDQSGSYHKALIAVLGTLEGQEGADELALVVAQLACVAVIFHDLGKADVNWQAKVRALDPGCPPGLVGRSLGAGQRIGVPHTPPAYLATIEACRLLVGGTLGNAESLVRAIALAGCRHHSSLFNPANVKNYAFYPHGDADDFVRAMLLSVGAPPEVVTKSRSIIARSQMMPDAQDVPLMLPNHDLFPVYALIGRAILLADREDASGGDLEVWHDAI